MAEEAEISFNEQLRRLKRGKSIAKTERYALDDLPADGLNARLSTMRKNLNALVSRQRDELAGINFRVESAVTPTNDNEAILLVVAITRI